MLRIGWAVREMTPRRPVMLQGQMYRRVARGSMDPVMATALAIEGGDGADCGIVISCDLCMIPDELQRAVRQRLARSIPEVPGEKVFLNATHTHTSMVLAEGGYEHPGGEVMTPAECTEWAADRAAEAAAEAWRSRGPQDIAFAFGHAVVGHNRRAVYADGRAEMYGRTDREDFVGIEGYEDHSLDMLFAWDGDGELTGLALALPCPSQVDEHLEVLSADFWHEIRVELRRRLGERVHVLPLCGAAGDISPHFLLYGAQEEEMRRRRGVTEREEIALRVAEGVERALACTRPTGEEAVFAHAVRRVELSARRITRAERDWAQAQYERAIEEGNAEGWWPRRMREVVESFDSGRPAGPVPVEVHVMRIGEAAVATNPFELFLDYGLRIKARSPAAQTFVVQLAAGCAGYLPSARAVAGGGYGAVPASTRVGPEGGQELVEHTLSAIRELFSPAAGPDA